MENFNLKVMGSKEYIDQSKADIKKLLGEGMKVDDVVEEVFKNFPKDTKELIIKDLKIYL